ncbi:diguanylate cyclase (GGDEF) domain-containing protein [Paenibacillus sp. 1_12]|uniref:GGDEF domain-containing protein n=1 Tax=Paenibacillus sp. 1_12 TaxID=1566278 RepID=UPI0008F38A60|nr:GGDEF domain-containing protein [Paenibacillus sp. 1_12]SFL80242.1 diguanylate cyclase (GGDEF) domain-containing protein [Paenibacillus sp. 1_12]
MEKYTDTMTHLHNNKALELNVQALLKKEDNVAIALIDVDHLKEINDELGSEKGDEVLQKLAAAFAKLAPDQAYRVSGDEFAIVMPGLTLEQAFLKMELLRTSIEANQHYGLPDNWLVTVTIGVAQYPRDAKEYQALNRAADAALMTAKEIGRNQVALPPTEEMVMKSCYYSSISLRRLKQLAEGLNKKESLLLREALDDLFKKYDKR